MFLIINKVKLDISSDLQLGELNTILSDFLTLLLSRANTTLSGFNGAISYQWTMEHSFERNILQSAQETFLCCSILRRAGDARVCESAYRGRGWLLLGDYSSCTQLGTDLLPLRTSLFVFSQIPRIITARIEQQNTCLRGSYTLIRTQLSADWTKKLINKKRSSQLNVSGGTTWFISCWARPALSILISERITTRQLSFTLLSTQSQQQDQVCLRWEVSSIDISHQLTLQSSNVSNYE